jgi:hypothetical protein
MSRFIKPCLALAVLAAVTLTALLVQKHMLVSAPAAKPTPIKQVIAQCELRARDKYDFRNDLQYSEGMEYVRVCMLSLGYQFEMFISECQSILLDISNRRETKTEEERNQRTGEIIRTFLPTQPDCYKPIQVQPYPAITYREEDWGAAASGTRNSKP